MDLLPVMRHRIDLLARWTGWATELAEQEKALHSSLDPRVEAVISGKKLLLLRSYCPIDGLARCPSSR